MNNSEIKEDLQKQYRDDLIDAYKKGVNDCLKSIESAKLLSPSIIKQLREYANEQV